MLLLQLIADVCMIGPKLYIASADHSHVGTTSLHQDVTSAVNIMLYADDTSATCGAEWTIFQRKDAPALREYLRQSRQHPSGDPILSTDYFLNDDDFKALETLHIYPFRFTQRVGDAVFINVGCPHQVRSMNSVAAY